MDPLNIKDLQAINYSMAKVDLPNIMEIYTKVSGKMKKLKEKEYLLIKIMEIYMMENGKKINNMALELNHGLKEPLYIKDSSLTVLKQEKELLSKVTQNTKAIS